MRVRIGIIDSGIEPSNPYVGGVAGGVCLLGGGDWSDRIGHGTVVAATIREKAPESALYSIRIFGRHLVAKAELLADAIRWCGENGMDFMNLSLGTPEQAHVPLLEVALADARFKGVCLLSVFEENGTPFYPGSLESATAVIADAAVGRNEYRRVHRRGREVLAASPLPRPMPGMPYARGLEGTSFAVANATGLLAAGVLSPPASPDASIHRAGGFRPAGR
jgi:subtilisin family serine protease